MSEEGDFRGLMDVSYPTPGTMNKTRAVAASIQAMSPD